MLVQAFVGAICANILTAYFVFSLWRIHKNERDYRAIFGVLVCAVIVIVASYALKYPN